MLLSELMYPHGRLPPLQAIGRTTTFDDEQEDSLFFPADSDFGADSADSFPLEIESRRFGPNDGEATAKILQRNFNVFEPGSHVCRKSSEHGSSFTHCTNGMSVARHYAHLRHLMEERAMLDFVRDYVSRIKALAAFVKDLENLVKNEYHMWYNVSHSTLTEAPNTKLYCLATVCEDLRMHINHWNCIKQRWHTDRWLKATHKKLSLELDLVHHTLFKLRDSAIWWVERLIKIGLEVFGNSDGESITQDMLWNICRGLEEFNSIVNGIHHSTSHDICQVKFPLTCLHGHRVLQVTAGCHSSNSVAQIGSCLRPISFQRVLTIVASERAKYAALKSHHFFTTNDGFVTLIHNTSLPRYLWCAADMKADRSKPSAQPVSQCDEPQTSDYYTGSSKSHTTTNLTSPMLRFQSVLLPDLSGLSPLLDFVEQEQDFVSRLLNVACTSTNLLRKNGSSHLRGSGKARGYASPSRPPRGPVDESALLRSDLKRKCVSWGDSADTSVRLQVASRYFQALWHGFESHLNVFFNDGVWGLEDDYVDSELGSIILSSDMTVMIIRQLLQHACVEGCFPTGSLGSLVSLRKNLLHHSALSRWQTEMASALGSFVTDKFYPCPLATGNYSTKTGMLLRDAFQPLLCELIEQLTPHLLSKGAVPKADPDLCVVVKLAACLLSTCQLSYQWCYTKTYQLLASWSVGSFLLVTQTDLKMLADETKHGLSMSQSLFSTFVSSSGNSADYPLIQELASIIQHLEDISGQMQTLSGAAMKLFGEMCKVKSLHVFQDVMPVGKVWKKKTNQDLPTEHSEYVEQVVDCILEPVLEGVTRLKPTSQLGVISLATVALCDTWTEFILKEKIKFSYEGAHQLSLDFKYLPVWLDHFISKEEVKQSVLELSIFRKLSGIIQLLMKQPRKKTHDTCSIDDFGCENSINTESTHGSVETITPSAGNADSALFNSSSEESDVNHVQNMEPWLALRLNSSSRWKLSSCFTGNSS